MARPHGAGQLYIASGNYYGRWRTPDGRRLNRRIGKVRTRGEKDGLTKPQAEAALRAMIEAEGTRRPPPPGRKESQVHTVDQVIETLRDRLAMSGARTSYLENCESMQRIHISPAIGRRHIDAVTEGDIERLARSMLRRGSAPKTIRNVMTFLHSVFALAIQKGWASSNPVPGAARPRRRRAGDASPDLQFLTIAQLDRVLDAILDETVQPESAPTRRGRRGPAPPPPPDVLGPVLRVVILTAAMSGLRQSELLGLRWRDVDFPSQRIRVRNAFVRGEHSADGKSDLSTRRSIPMTDRLHAELERWHDRTLYSRPDELVFAHPLLGAPLDRTKVTRRFQRACRDAGVPAIRFHDLRHTFGTMLAASVPLRTIQEFLGHADLKTTQIYAHYAKTPWEVDLVNAGFDPFRNHDGS
jgi:integrase